MSEIERQNLKIATLAFKYAIAERLGVNVDDLTFQMFLEAEKGPPLKDFFGNNRIESSG